MRKCDPIADAIAISTGKLISVATLFVLGMCVVPNLCVAGITTLGPTPYLSKADSPFPVDGSNPNFYLEDFEDGLLNTSGIAFGVLGSLDPLNRPIVFAPSIITDSVDADDGVVDGNGQGGHSLASGFTLDDGVFGYSFLMEFQFNQTVLGFLPNTFGFVWTDGPAPGSVYMTITTGTGATYQTPYWRNLGDASREGTTADDVFFGVIADEGILRVRITGQSFYDGLSSGKYMEIDHVQYGLAVPEPGPMSMLFAATCGAAQAARRRRKLR